ncbi:MAG: 4-hydroxy-tetrahydrodipicolinate synthase [Alphaproteobacteria bacterium MarineAlpha5_Bin9]|nr:MAG: 4-hydroxy-tetrahydrodipicolinate synthase [Alphaproteobacteria bacterium MarineAlpha5_Bin9]|tara:strand:+ start:31731 stop:32651 length:921 start_codon:yes stop_codon:yes gene_type:complete
MNKISGVFSASLTPYNEDFSVNNKMLLEHCNSLIKKIDGIAIFGTTGEANLLSINQKIESLEFLINNNFDSNRLIPGTGLNSIKDTIFFTKAVSKMKVKAVLMLPPFYYKKINSNGLIDYYSRVIEEVADNNLNYLLYHIPQMSGISIDLNVIEKLISKFPKNIIGIKDSSENIDNMLKMIKIFPEFSVLSGSDSLALKAVKHGGSGAITAAANIAGELLSFIVNNWKKEPEIDNFFEFQKLIEDIRAAIFSGEPISTLKAFLSVDQNNQEWNRLMPPLSNIESPEQNTAVNNLIDLSKKMKNLLS